MEYRSCNLSASRCKISTEEVLNKLLCFTSEMNKLSLLEENKTSELQKLQSSLENNLQVNILKENFNQFTEHMCQMDDTFRFWHDFIHKHCFSYVSLFLAFRNSNWNLRMGSLKNLAPLFHAYDRHMYLRLIPNHIADVLTMPICILDHLRSGGFSATKTGKAWQQLALDEAHESFINLDVKDSVRKPSPDLLDTMAVYLPYRATLCSCYLVTKYILVNFCTALADRNPLTSILSQILAEVENKEMSLQ